jgi:hypothetical protein
MPLQYEKIRDNIHKRLLAKGMNPVLALKRAKGIAAATYNSRRKPGQAPVTGKD